MAGPFFREPRHRSSGDGRSMTAAATPVNARCGTVLTDRHLPGRIRSSVNVGKQDHVLVGNNHHEHYHYAPTGFGRRVLRCAAVARTSTGQAGG